MHLPVEQDVSLAVFCKVVVRDRPLREPCYVPEGGLIGQTKTSLKCIKDVNLPEVSACAATRLVVPRWRIKLSDTAQSASRTAATVFGNQSYCNR
jgi:hypothetical protein